MPTKQKKPAILDSPVFGQRQAPDELMKLLKNNPGISLTTSCLCLSLICLVLVSTLSAKRTAFGRQEKNDQELAATKKMEESGSIESVTIPIEIRRGKLHFRGTVNESANLDLIFDTGANANVLYPSAIDKNAILEFDGTTNNVGTGGASIRQTSSNNCRNLDQSVSMMSFSFS